MLSEQKRAFLAVLLSGLVLFSWQFFFAPKTTTKQDNKVTSAADGAIPSVQLGSPVNHIENSTTPEKASALVQTYIFEYGEQKFVFDSNFKFVHFKTKNNFADFEGFFGTNESIAPFQMGSTPFFISSVETNGNYFKATDAEKTFSIEGKFKENGALELKFNSRLPVAISLKATNKSEDKNHHRDFIALAAGVQREPVGKDLFAEGQLKWFGVDYNYHFFGFSFENKILAKVTSNESGELRFMSGNGPLSLVVDVFFTKKNYDLLTSLGNNLELSVDFGIWGIIAVPILRGLQFFYRFIPNYGISIILLTIIIRLITFPLQYKSFKSMKKMQQLQPELTKIKEKFKDDPTRLQKETMDLFKTAGANPLGGCLPLLLQMPFFMAFYKVLYAAVELVHAPFYFWIHDLSVKDPFFILPVFMTITMFAQQKLTPAAGVDPNQQKIMLIMPLVFGFIMKDLPAGLVLYIFVSTILGIVQQTFVNKSVKV